MDSRLAILDLDGTLADAFDDIGAALNHALSLRNLPLHSRDSVRTMVGDGVGKLVERAAPNQSKESHQAIRADLLNYYRKHPADHTFLYPGIPEALQKLKQNKVRLAVLSNKPHDLTVAVCEALGLTKYCDLIQGEDAPRTPRKPDPTGISRILQTLQPARAIVVGDGQPDGEVARNADLPFVACLWGTRNEEQLIPYQPIALARESSQLAETILQVLQQGEKSLRK